ncbi:MAG: hypothetical protein WEC37_01945 [Anaerolineales bacterium]
MKFSKRIQNLFSGENRKVDRTLLAVFLLINLITLINSVIHNPEMGYDAEEHLLYITILPTRLPLYSESKEFFSPPLPYLAPSLLHHFCSRIFGDENIVEYRNLDCRKVAGKFSQFINVVLSLGSMLLILSIADVLRPNNRTFKLAAISLLGLLTVYYRTLAQVRGEPYVLFFMLLAIYLIAKILTNTKELTWKNGVLLGFILGLLVLSRQWGFLIFPAIFGLVVLVYRSDKSLGIQFAKMLALSTAVAALVGGWFYVHLYSEYGSFTAFNQTPTQFSLANEPASFYRNTGLADFLIFKDPVRPTFDNQFIPIFYSDTWGDYWGFLVFVRDLSYLGVLGLGNEDQIAPYLGRVNFVSIVPSLALLGGAFVGAASVAKALIHKKKPDRATLLFGFLFLIVLVSFIGYLSFVISFPVRQGDTIKSTYMLHLFVILLFLAADFIDRIETHFPGFLKIYGALLALVFLHNLPAMISRYSYP